MAQQCKIVVLNVTRMDWLTCCNMNPPRNADFFQCNVHLMFICLFLFPCRHGRFCTICIAIGSIESQQSHTEAADGKRGDFRLQSRLKTAGEVSEWSSDWDIITLRGPPGWKRDHVRRYEKATWTVRGRKGEDQRKLRSWSGALNLFCLLVCSFSLPYFQKRGEITKGVVHPVQPTRTWFTQFLGSFEEKLSKGKK